MGGMTIEEEKATRKLHGRYRAVSFLPSDFIPSLLYHYTSAVGLVGIVSSGVLRASNFSYLNDATEIMYGRQLAQEIVIERLESEQTDTNRMLLTRAQKSLEDIGKGVDFYLACFCTKPDLLSQWRAYGSARGRFCIGFDTEDSPPGLDDKLSCVLYNRDEQRQKVQKAIDAAVEALDVGDSPSFLDRVAELLLNKLIDELCFFKHHGFTEEHEWRAVHLSDPKDTIEFDTATGLIKPYVDLWIGAEGEDGLRKLPIVEIIVGAGFSITQTKKSVELLLTRYGYTSVEIKESEVPYREL